MKDGTETKNVISATLRLPVDLRKALQEIAAREGRTLHGQIVYVLRRFVEEESRG